MWDLARKSIAVLGYRAVHHLSLGNFVRLLWVNKSLPEEFSLLEVVIWPVNLLRITGEEEENHVRFYVVPRLSRLVKARRGGGWFLVRRFVRWFSTASSRIRCFAHVWSRQCNQCDFCGSSKTVWTINGGGPNKPVFLCTRRYKCPVKRRLDSIESQCSGSTSLGRQRPILSTL